MNQEGGGGEGAQLKPASPLLHSNVCMFVSVQYFVQIFAKLISKVHNLYVSTYDTVEMVPTLSHPHPAVTLMDPQHTTAFDSRLVLDMTPSIYKRGGGGGGGAGA